DLEAERERRPSGRAEAARPRGVGVAVAFDAQLQRRGEAIAQQQRRREQVDVDVGEVIALDAELRLKDAAADRLASVGDAGAVGVDRLLCGQRCCGEEESEGEGGTHMRMLRWQAVKTD